MAGLLRTLTYNYNSEPNPSFERMGEFGYVFPHGTEQSTRRDFTIVVAGVGGTGGYVVRDLSRFIFSIMKRTSNYNIRLVVIDPDKVEEKNLLRQNFLPSDLGKGKAEVIATRHSRAFGIQIEFIEAKASMDVLRRLADNSYMILVGCVDNHSARRDFHQYMTFMRDAGRTCSWIDSGNERTSGQVVLGDTTRMPVITALYPEILDATKDTKSEISCAERLMQDEQNIFVNLTAANHVLNFIRTVILNERTLIHGVAFNISGKVDSYFLMDPTKKKLKLSLPQKKLEQEKVQQTLEELQQKNAEEILAELQEISRDMHIVDDNGEEDDYIYEPEYSEDEEDYEVDDEYFEDDDDAEI